MAQSSMIERTIDRMACYLLWQKYALPLYHESTASATIAGIETCSGLPLPFSADHDIFLRTNKDAIPRVRGVARLTRLPVTEKIEGSNPFAPAMQSPANSGVFAWRECNGDTSVTRYTFFSKSFIASASSDVLRCVYRSVILISECPINFCTAKIFAPKADNCEANVCRKSCQEMTGTPASRQHRCSRSRAVL